MQNVRRANRRYRRAVSSTLLENLEARQLMSAAHLGKSFTFHTHAPAEVHHEQAPSTVPANPVAVAISSTPVVTAAPADPLAVDPASTTTVSTPVSAPADPATTATTPADTTPTTTVATQVTTPGVSSAPVDPLLPMADAANGTAATTTAYADPRADLNHDGVVDIIDFTIVSSHWQQTGTPGTLVGDVNGDGVVDILDSTIVTNNWQLSVAPAAPVSTVQYDWHSQVINGALNLWAPNPTDFGATYTVTDPNALFGTDGVPQMETIHQGPTADCYFLAAEGSLALNNPSRIESIVKNDAGGGWAVTFQYWDYTKGAYVPVVIHTDDELSSALQPQQGSEVWDLAIEKAFAAFRTWNGSTSTNTMASIGWGYAGTALSMLGDFNSSVPITGFSQQYVYNTLQSELAQHLPILFHTSTTAPTMVQSHVYVITGVSTDSNGIEWVTTYNPWGFYETRKVSDLLLNTVGTLVVGTT